MENLGVHRSSVTRIAKGLQQADLSTTITSKFEILDVEGLKEVSRECDEAFSAQFRRNIE